MTLKLGEPNRRLHEMKCLFHIANYHPFALIVRLLRLAGFIMPGVIIRIVRKPLYVSEFGYSP